MKVRQINQEAVRRRRLLKAVVQTYKWLSRKNDELPEAMLRERQVELREDLQRLFAELGFELTEQEARAATKGAQHEHGKHTPGLQHGRPAPLLDAYRTEEGYALDS